MQGRDICIQGSCLTIKNKLLLLELIPSERSQNRKMTDHTYEFCYDLQSVTGMNQNNQRGISCHLTMFHICRTPQEKIIPP